MKRVALFILITLPFCKLFAQSAGAQICYIQPVSGLQYTLKPGIGLELVQSLTQYLDNRVNVIGSIGFYYHRTTSDTFRSVTYTNSSSRGPIIPSTLRLKHYRVLPLELSVEVKILDKNLSPFIGGGINIMVIHFDYVKDIPGIINESSSALLWQTGFNPKIGISYLLNDEYLISTGICRNFGLIGSAESHNNIKSFLRVIYEF